MRSRVFLIVGLFFAVVAEASPRATRSEVVMSGKSQASLIAPSFFAPGEDFTVALLLDPEENWHNYWVNPGDSGMATTVEWTLPEGMSAGPLRFPVPHRFESGGLVGFGYSEPAFLLTKIHVPEGFSATEIEIKASVSWLACDDNGCVPGDAKLQVLVKAGDKMKAVSVLPGVDQTVYPSEMSGDLKNAIALEDEKFLVFTAEVSPDLEKLLAGELTTFFESSSIVDYGEAATVTLEGRQLSIRGKKSEFFGEMPAEVAVVAIPTERANSVRLVFSKK